jgi:mRNA interferase HigB
MRVINKPRLRVFWHRHPDAKAPLTAWWKIARKARWESIDDVHVVYPQADAVALDCGIVATVFNIGGNKYRLVVRIEYQFHCIYVKMVMTHAEYDKEKWKVQLCQE